MKEVNVISKILYDSIWNFLLRFSCGIRTYLPSQSDGIRIFILLSILINAVIHDFINMLEYISMIDTLLYYSKSSLTLQG